MITDDIQKAWNKFSRTVAAEFAEDDFSYKSSAVDTGAKSSLSMAITDKLTNKKVLTVTMNCIDPDVGEEEEPKKKKKKKDDKPANAGTTEGPVD